MSITTAQPHTYTYRTTSEWTGRRNGRLSVSGKEAVIISSPHEFRGETALLNPEELFVASVETCFMLTFISMAEKYHLPVEAFFSETSGVLEYADGNFHFTRITLKPTIVINDAGCAPRVLEIVEHARKDCLISNSIRTQVEVQPEVVMDASE